MYIKYRVKRNSGPVYESIPAHPDAIYRPQYRPTPIHSPPLDSDIAAPRLLASNPMVAAPLTASPGGFSLGWIIGPSLAILAAIVLAGLVYGMKKKQNLKRKLEEEEEKENTPEKKDAFNVKARPSRKDPASVENIPLKTMKSDVSSTEKHRTMPVSSTAQGHQSIISNNVDQQSTFLTHNSPSTNDRSAVSSTKRDGVSSSLSDLSHMNIPQMGKSSSNIENLISHSMTNPPLKQARSLSNHRTEPNYSHDNILPLSPTKTISSSKKTSGNPSEENPKEWPLSHSRSESTNPNILKKTGQSPPTGSKHSLHRKSQSELSEKEHISSNLDSQDEVLSKETRMIFSLSDTKKTHPSSSSPQLHTDQTSNSRPQIDFNRTKNPSQSDRVISTHLHDDKTDESNTSLSQSNSPNRSKGNVFLPHVPVCKANASSDDDEYDEIYTILSTKSSNTNRNYNQHSIISAKPRISRLNKSLGKRLD